MIVLCLASNDYAEKYDFCIESQKRYCNKYNHNYKLITGTPESRNWKRSKIDEVEDILCNSLEDILLLDCDCFLKENTPNVKNINSSKSIYYANGKSGRPNSGVMFFKNNDDSKNFVKKLKESLPLSLPNQKYFVTSEGENGHVNWIIDTYPTDIFYILPSLWNNTNRKEIDQAFILHFTNSMKKVFTKYKNEYSRSSQKS